MTRRRGGDQVEVEFALQPLLDDLQMQQAQEAAAEAEAQRGRGFRSRSVKLASFSRSLAERFAQILEIGRIDREQAAEHHGLRRLEAGQRRRRAGLRSSVIVSPTW